MKKNGGLEQSNLVNLMDIKRKAFGNLDVLTGLLRTHCNSLQWKEQVHEVSVCGHPEDSRN